MYFAAQTVGTRIVKPKLCYINSSARQWHVDQTLIAQLKIYRVQLELLALAMYASSVVDCGMLGQIYVASIPLWQFVSSKHSNNMKAMSTGTDSLSTQQYCLPVGCCNIIGS